MGEQGCYQLTCTIFLLFSPIMEDELSTSKYTVAVIGSAVAGAQVAGQLADRGARVVVFEQNERPFGKIEDGLPRWHSALRDKEFAKILNLLDNPRIQFVPKTRIGQDIPFEELVRSWGFSAVVLANGSWRDRLLPIPEADKWINKGLVYQNPFVQSFNHEKDPNYTGKRYDYPDGGLVVGGGLASIDMAKLLMLETSRAKLAENGHDIDIEALEKKGIPKACEEFGTTFEALGVQGCTLVYRRRAEDMPVASVPKGATPEKILQIEGQRRKILERARSKFCFRFLPLTSPEAALTDGDRLIGLRLRKMARDGDGKLTRTDEVVELRSSIVISSIGSIPEPIPGIEMNGELFAFNDWDLGRLDGYPTVFSAGNVVTGKGNIVASRKHAGSVAGYIIEKYLGLTDSPAESLPKDLTEEVKDQARVVIERVYTQVDPVTLPAVELMRKKVAARQQAVGYTGSIRDWVVAHPPPPA